MDPSRLTFNGENTPWIAVTLERTTACNMHAGILYRNADNHLWRLHFGWHRHLIHEPYSGSVGCAIPPLELADQEFMAGFCGLIARHGPRRTIPYNLKYDEDVTFDLASGEIRFGPTSTGLGCATFVLAVFRSAGNRLVDTTGWPNADHIDLSVQRSFVNMLLDSKSEDARQQGRTVNREIGTPRVRPDHVAGAALEDEGNVTYPVCERNGRFVAAEVDRQLPIS